MSDPTELNAFLSARSGASAAPAKDTTSKEEPPKNETTETNAQEVEKPEAKQDAKPEAQKDDKPEGKPKKAKFDPEAFKAEQTKALESLERKLFGHIGGITRTLNEVKTEIAAAKAAAKTVDDAPTQAQIDTAAKDPEEWEKLKQEWPEWAAAFEKKIDAKLAAVKPAEFDQNKFISEAQIAFETKQREAAAARLERDFPQWRSPENYSALTQWLETQPDHVKALAESDWIDDARQLLTLYKQSKETPPTKPEADKPKDTTRQKRFEAAITPKGSGGHAPGPETEREAFLNARRRR
jgi:hypothetical protein